MFHSNNRKKQADRRQILTSLLYTAVFNTAIAGLLTTVGFGSSFGVTWMFSQCVGLTICTCVMLAFRWIEPTQKISQAATLILSLSVGAVVGTAMGSAFLWFSAREHILAYGFVLQVIGISILFGLIITYFFHSREKLAVSAQMINDERIKRLSSEKQMLEANLKRLQAQIEPHFLFNTLSNIVSLMETDAAKAKAMQLDLIRYLRTTLRRSRGQQTTLGQEFDLIRAYLDIYKIRMGERLVYQIEIPESLMEHPFVPMLLQPLVENAIIHGLEPMIDGGHIMVRAVERDGFLILEVADTGNGIQDSRKPGLGLTNVKERVKHLFGDHGRLRITENQPSGVCVAIEVPLTGQSVDPEKMESYDA